MRRLKIFVGSVLPMLIENQIVFKESTFKAISDRGIISDGG